MALTWSAAVIGLSAETVSATALPFSIRGGRSIFTLPFFADASPSTFLIAPRIDSGVADAGTVVSARLTLPASAAASIRKRRRVAYGLSSLLVIMVASVRVASVGPTPLRWAAFVSRARSRDGRPHPRSARPSTGAYPGTPALRAQALRGDNRAA